MKKRIVIALVLGAVLALGLGGTAAFAHTHIELPNGDCVSIPVAIDNENSQAGNAHGGIGTAKQNEGTPFSGGWCP